MATKTRLKAHVLLPSDEVFNELKTNGSYTQGDITVTYDPTTTVYLTPGNGGGSGLSGDTVVVTDTAGKLINSGVSTTEVGFLSNARSNIQAQIDAITSQIGSGSNNYIVDTWDEVDYDKPGNWYVSDKAGTYFHYVVDDAGNGKMVATNVSAADINAADLSAYQKKSDTNITVKNTSGTVVATVTGALNTLESKIGSIGWPLSTKAQTLAEAINELAISGGTGTGTTSTINLNGTAGITVTNPSVGTYNVGHSNNFSTSVSNKVLGTNTHGKCTLYLPYIDQYGHINPGASTSITAYIPTSGGANGQVWTYNSTSQKGYWSSAASSYTLPTASSSTLGGVKIGSGITISNGVISATGGVANQVTYTAPAGSSSNATTVQEAIDKLENRIKELEAKIATFSYDATSETLSITTP